MNGELGRGCGGSLDAWAERARNTHRQLDTEAEGRTTLSPESMSVVGEGCMWTWWRGLHSVPFSFPLKNRLFLLLGLFF